MTQSRQDGRRSDEARDSELHEQARKLLKDSDLMKVYWEQGHAHFWSRTWERIRQSLGGWLIAGILSGAAGALIVTAVQRGWIK